MRAGMVAAWLAVALLGLVKCAAGADLFLRGATVWTVSGETLQRGDVLISSGKISAVGEAIEAPDGAEIVDLQGKHVCPGFIDAHSHLGVPPGELDETVRAISADMRVHSAFRAGREGVRRAAASGVTTLLLSPGESNVIAGPCSAVKLGGAGLLKPAACMKIVLGRTALMRDRRPTSLPGLYEMIRQEFASTDRDGESSLAAALRGEMPTIVFCDGMSEVKRAISLADEFGLRVSIVAPGVAHRMGGVLAHGGVPAICAPLNVAPRDKFLSAPARLAAAGVRIAFSSMAPQTDECDLRTSASLAASAGLPQATALHALTLGAAEIIGVADRVGSIEAGKDADLVVIAGHPLDLSAPIELVLVDGKAIYERETR